jgi:hypothetical protein
MYAPSGSHAGNKLNPNPPKVTFRRIRGRVVPIINGKQPRGATRPLREELFLREMEVREAAKGMRGAATDEYGNIKGFGTKSTFPPFFRELGFNSRKQFLEVVKKKQGRKYDQLVEDSIESLIKGRESEQFGRIPPNEKFRLATKQEFNNKGVIFRKINGKIIPLRPKYMREKYNEEVPF